MGDILMLVSAAALVVGALVVGVPGVVARAEDVQGVLVVVAVVVAVAVVDSEILCSIINL
jgi:hypothetical protein